MLKSELWKELKPKWPKRSACCGRQIHVSFLYQVGIFNSFISSPLSLSLIPCLLFSPLPPPPPPPPPFSPPSSTLPAIGMTGCASHSKGRAGCASDQRSLVPIPLETQGSAWGSTGHSTFNTLSSTKTLSTSLR